VVTIMLYSVCTEVIRSSNATYCVFILHLVCRYGNISTVKKAEMEGHEDGKKRSNETRIEVNTSAISYAVACRTHPCVSSHKTS
jgi:hypothetical protein